MKHVEFTGPAGSGKTTLLERLTTKHESLVSKNELIYTKLYLNQAIRTVMPREILERVMRLGWSKHSKYKYFFDFARYHPEFVSNSILFVQRQRGKSKNKEGSIMDVMSVYQFAQENMKNDQFLVLDEGFYHKTAVHAKHGNLPSDQYLATMPNPDVLIHVDPPIEIARQRCEDRDGKVASREVYEQARRTKRKLISMARDIGVDVIEVENNEKIESTVDQIQAEILNS